MPLMSKNRRPAVKKPLSPLVRQPALRRDETEGEESLVIDQRSNLQPSQAVEEKLRLLMKNQSLPLSMLRFSQAGQRRR